MGSGGLTRKEIQRLVLHVEPQGVKATKVKNGLLLRLPDGTSTTVHWTSSDVRAASNLRARLRRAGVTWPTDGLNRTRYSPSPDTMAKGFAALAHLGAPEEVTIIQLQAAHEEIAPGQTFTRMSAQRYLMACGYFQVGQARGARWLRSTEPDTHDPDPVVVPEPEPVQVASVVPMASVGMAREFLDTVDSFTLDLANIQDIPLGVVMSVLAAAGMSVEVRAWQGVDKTG